MTDKIEKVFIKLTFSWFKEILFYEWTKLIFIQFIRVHIKEDKQRMIGKHGAYSPSIILFKVALGGIILQNGKCLARAAGYRDDGWHIYGVSIYYEAMKEFDEIMRGPVNK